MSKTKNIILVDIKDTGHRSTYMCEFARSFLNLGYNVKIFFPKPELVEKRILAKCENYADNLECYVLSDFNKNQSLIETVKPQILFWLFRFYRLKNELRKRLSANDLSESLVFLNWYEDFKINFPSKWKRLKPAILYLQKILMNRIFDVRWATLIDQFSVKIEHQKGILSSDYFIGACVFINSSTHRYDFIKGKPIYPIPDFSEFLTDFPETRLVKELSDKANKRKIIGIAGHLHKRKGLLNLIRIANNLDSRMVFFAFVGSMDWDSFSVAEVHEIKQTLTRENCFFHLSFVESEHELCSMMREFSIIYAAYINFEGSSGMLFKAALLQTPVIVSHNSLMSDIVEKQRLGESIDPGSIDEGTQAINKILNSRDEAYSYDQYLSQHHPDQLDKIFQKMIQFQDSL